MPHSDYARHLMGSATIDPTGAFEAGSFASFTLPTPPATSASTTPARSRSCTASPATWASRSSPIRRAGTTRPSKPAMARCCTSNTTASAISARGTRPCSSAWCAAIRRRRTDHRALRRHPPGLARHARADLPRTDFRVQGAGGRFRHVQLCRDRGVADDLRGGRPPSDTRPCCPACHWPASRCAWASRARTNGATCPTRRRAASTCAATCAWRGCPSRSTWPPAPAPTAIEDIVPAETGDLRLEVLHGDRVVARSNRAASPRRRRATTTGPTCTASRKKPSAPTPPKISSCSRATAPFLDAMSHPGQRFPDHPGILGAPEHPDRPLRRAWAAS